MLKKMTLTKLNNKTDFKALYAQVGCSTEGVEIMAKKSRTHLFYIQNLRTPAANILKQDALSIGADLVVPASTILCETKYVDAVLIATNAQIQKIIKKEKAQPFGLKNLSKELGMHLKNSVDFVHKKAKIMGVINANDDSFFSGSRFKDKEAVEKIYQMINDGANIIDIGGVSSRPGSVEVSENEELSRIQPIIDAIYKEKIFEKITFSLDSYNPKSIQYALERGFKIVNDITGLTNEKIAKLIANYNAKVVIMHMQNKPQNMQDNPTYTNVLSNIEEFFTNQIKFAKSFGIEKKDIILDAGIGFGKTLQHNLDLIKNLEHFKKFGCDILVGASRKSLINKITPTIPEDRLPGTLALHLESLRNGATMLRVHDVKEHFQVLKIYEALKNSKLN
jgi:dihydropteroate synthase